ncbi:hypothetical protein BCR34DRAFT_476626 [Clohesyomyces aquaticus]|uniref:Rhodopsin domain-containing protein n=1 Tax=Clohesyomyces aquaticus TaxID=1231657 RepID=A0A1Y2A2J8_9PLEO|nr:hypothetical protein BCR34DRAFT_476626 [Clohesyomyces aquaticus]
MPDGGLDIRAARVIVVTAVCVLLSILIVALRFHVRRNIIKKFGSDDWALTVAVVLFIGVSTMTASCTKVGLGRPFPLLPPSTQSLFLRLIFICSLLYGLVLLPLKTAFLLQYRRSFPLPPFQRICDISLFFLLLWGLSGGIGALLYCRPISKNWDPKGEAWRKCEGRLAFWMSMGIIHVVSDVGIFLLPLPMVRGLRVGRREKGVLIGVFSLGFFSCAISIIRLTTLRASTLGPDPTYTMPNTVIWSVAEVTCAIICACIPTLRPLLPRWCSGWQKHSYQQSIELDASQRSGEEGLGLPRLNESSTRDADVIAEEDRSRKSS